MFTGTVHIFYTHIYICVHIWIYTHSEGFWQGFQYKNSIILDIFCHYVSFPPPKKIHRDYSRTNCVTLIDLFNNFMTFDLLSFSFCIEFLVIRNAVFHIVSFYAVYPFKWYVHFCEIELQVWNCHVKIYIFLNCRFSDCLPKGFSNLNFYMGFRKVPFCLWSNSADKTPFQNWQYNWYKVLPQYKFFDIRLIIRTVDNPVFLLNGN